MVEGFWLELTGVLEDLPDLDCEILLVDGEGNYYFIEINARIQVEHPVTEMLSGIDIVGEQIRLASGEELGYGQDAVRLRGHAIEFRINAEDVKEDFRPQAGLVERRLHDPPRLLDRTVDHEIVGQLHWLRSSAVSMSVGEPEHGTSTTSSG